MKNSLQQYIIGFFILMITVSGCSTSIKQESLAFEEYEEGIHHVASAIAEGIATVEKNAVAIMDFTDSQGNVIESGETIAEDLSLALADSGKGFWIVSGAYLKELLKKYEPATNDLMENPLTTNQLWQVMGIEAVVTGTLEPLNDNLLQLSTSILDINAASSPTASAEIIDKVTINIAKVAIVKKQIQEKPKRRGGISDSPWPPPEASASAKIPSEFLVNSDSSTSLQEVAERLEKAFDQAGYGERSYYRIPDGFALVSRMEQFYSDGTSKEPPDRWVLNIDPPQKFSLTSYIKALFAAQEGHYRIIAFIVTSQPFGQPSQAITSDEAMMWISLGAKALPTNIGIFPYTNNHYCLALIYEFEQLSQNQNVAFKDLSDLRGIEHLKKSTIWSALFSLRAILQF